MRKYLQIFLIVPAAMLLAQCGGVPSTYYYRIDYDAPLSVTGRAPLPVTVAVAQFETDVVYQGDKIVYRSSPYEVQYYHYRRWVAPPRKLVEEAVLNQIRAARAFERVVRVPTLEPVDYVLRGNIKAFEEWDEGEAWFGHVQIEFELFDPERDEVVWRKAYAEKNPAGQKAPVEVVKSISEGVKKVVHQAVLDMAQHLGS